jgi:hypothetical protein
VRLIVAALLVAADIIGEVRAAMAANDVDVRRLIENGELKEMIGGNSASA